VIKLGFLSTGLFRKIALKLEEV